MRLLADERLRPPLEELIGLYEMRTGQRVRQTFVSPERLALLLKTGAHDVALGDRSLVMANPVTTEFDRSTYITVGISGAGVEFGCVLRRSSEQHSPSWAVWNFLRDAEARSVFNAAGLRPVDVGGPE